MQKSIILIGPFVLLFILASCQNKELVMKQVDLERWTTIGDSLEHRKGEIQYMESIFYLENGLIENISYYNPDKSLKAQEIRIIDPKTEKPTGAQYKNPQDSVLSYYVFESNAKGEIIEKRAYDSSSDELLRIEKLAYHDSGEVENRKIYDQLGMLQREYRHTLDEKGNEMQIEVLNGQGQLLVNEVFRDIKYNENGIWVEKWGFINNNPYSFTARSIKYYK